MDTELDAPHLAGDYAFTNFYAVHYDYPRVDYYGPGAGSHKTGRSDYQLESTLLQIRAGFKPIDRLRLGLIGEYLMENVSYGRDDDFVSTDRIFTEQTTPGVQTRVIFYRAAASFNSIGAITLAVRGAAGIIWRNFPIFPIYAATLIPSMNCIWRRSSILVFSTSAASSPCADG
jgi:hypothetical protein